MGHRLASPLRRCDNFRVGYFETEKGVDEYLGMTHGPDRGLVARLTPLLVAGASVLEIGIGPGYDLLLLAERYRVVGTDRSPIFVRRFGEQHPDIDVRVADAASLDIAERFDAVYSNKVLQHLSDEELRASLAVQHRVLVPGGVGLHGLWYGTECEHYAGLRFQQYIEESFAVQLGGLFSVESTVAYGEEKDGDSIAVILRKEA